MSTEAEPKVGGNTLSIDEFLALLRRHSLLIGAIVLGHLLVAIVICLMATRQYRAEIIVMPAENDGASSPVSALLGQAAGLASLAGVALSDSTAVAEATTILTSRGFLEEFADRMNLVQELYPQGKITEWRFFSRVVREPTVTDCYQVLRNRLLNIKRSAESPVIVVSLVWHDPVRAARWLNLLIDGLNESLRQRQLAQTSENLNYLFEQLKAAETVELRQAVARLIESEVRSQMVARGKKEFALRVLDPARPPLAGNYVFPKASILVPLAIFIGTIVGTFVAILVDGRRAAWRPVARAA